MSTSVRPVAVGTGIRILTVPIAEAAAAVPYDEAYDALDTRERERMARLGRAGDRLRYLAVHHVFRTLLGERLGITPAQVRFRRRCGGCGGTDHGKPVPCGPDGGVLSASLSHSAAYALVAISDDPGVPVGVDVERVRPHMDWSGIPCVRGGRVTHGFEQWTRAEALVKAAGTGLSRTPPSYTGRAFGSWRAARVPGSGQEWYVRSVRAPEGYTASVATAVVDARVNLALWRP